MKRIEYVFLIGAVGLTFLNNLYCGNQNQLFFLPLLEEAMLDDHNEEVKDFYCMPFFRGEQKDVLYDSCLGYLESSDIACLRCASTALRKHIQFEPWIDNALKKHIILLGSIDSLRNTLLHRAAKIDSCDFVRHLICAGAAVDAANQEGYLPHRFAQEGSDTRSFLESNLRLLAAAQKNDVGILYLELDHGAYVNVRSKNGMTPLHCAAQNGALACLRTLLVVPEIALNVPDNQGHSALDHALNTKRRRCATALCSALSIDQESVEDADLLSAPEADDDGSFFWVAAFACMGIGEGS